MFYRLQFQFTIITLALLFWFGCASQSVELIDLDRVEQAFHDLDAETAIKARKEKKMWEIKPEWVDPIKWEKTKYLYSSASEIIKTKESYDNIKNKIQKMVLIDISEQIRVTVEKVFIDIIQEKDGFYKEYAETVIKTNSRATFFMDEFDVYIYPDEHKIKVGDALWAYGRLDKIKYQKRLAKQRKEFEKKSEDYFNDAVKAYEDGNLQQCLNKIVMCKYYVDRGGGNILLQHFIDQTLGERPVVSQLQELHGRLKKILRFELIPKTNNNLVKFIMGESDKKIKIRLSTPSTSQMDLSGIELEAKDLDTGKLIRPITLTTDEQGLTIFNFKENLGDREVILMNIQLKLTPFGIDDDKVWFSSAMYQEFKTSLVSMVVSIENQAFPQRNVLTVVTKEEDVGLSLIEINGLKSELDQSVVDNSKFFNLLKQEAGMGLNELIRVISSKRDLNNEELDKLKSVDAIIHVSIESGSKFRLRIRLLNVVNKSFQVLAMSSLNIPGDSKLKTDGIKDLFDQFLDEWFFRSVKFNFNQKIDYILMVNDKKSSSGKEQTSIISKGLSRYHTYNFVLETDNYRTYRTTYAPEFFSFKSTNRKLSQSENVIIEDIKLEHKYGKLKVKVTDALGKKIRQRGRIQTSIDIFQPKYIFLKTNKLSSKGKSIYEFTVTNLGLYQVSVNHPGYAKPLPKFVNIKDSFELSGVQIVDFKLEEKSLLKAVTFSTAFPGLGHLYMASPWWQTILPASIYSTSIIASGIFYNDYYRNRSDFITFQNKYFEANENDPNIINMYYYSKAEESRGKMNDAKKYFKYSLYSAVLSNVLTNGLLYLQKKF